MISKILVLLSIIISSAESAPLDTSWEESIFHSFYGNLTHSKEEKDLILRKLNRVPPPSRPDYEKLLRQYIAPQTPLGFFINIAQILNCIPADQYEHVASLSQHCITPETSEPDKLLIIPLLINFPTLFRPHLQHWIAPQTCPKEIYCVLQQLKAISPEFQPWVERMATTYIPLQTKTSDTIAILNLLKSQNPKEQQWITGMAEKCIPQESPVPFIIDALEFLDKTHLSSDRKWMKDLVDRYGTAGQIEPKNMISFLKLATYIPLGRRNKVDTLLDALLPEAGESKSILMTALSQVSTYLRILPECALEDFRLHVLAGVQNIRANGLSLDEHHVQEIFTQIGTHMVSHLGFLEVPFDHQTVPLATALKQSLDLLGVKEESLSQSESKERINSWINRHTPEDQKDIYLYIFNDYLKAINPLLGQTISYLEAIGSEDLKKAWVNESFAEFEKDYDIRFSKKISTDNPIQPEEYFSALSLDKDGIDPGLRSLSKVARTFVDIIAPHRDGGRILAQDIIGSLSPDHKRILLVEKKTSDEIYSFIFQDLLPRLFQEKANITPEYAQALSENPCIQYRLKKTLQNYCEKEEDCL